MVFQYDCIIELTSLAQSSQSTASSLRAIKLSRLVAPPTITFRIHASFLSKDNFKTCHPLSYLLDRIPRAIPAARLLSIVLLLHAHHRVTSRDLATRLEVSERTIPRDMDALSGAGIPVIAARGIGGGWSLLGEYRTNLTGL